MTAKGKINASKVQADDRIIVQVSAGTGEVRPSTTKTGEGVFVARVTGKTFGHEGRGNGGYGRSTRFYTVHTTAGSFEAAPIQTMWLAPEDAPGIKRAHAEAERIDAQRDNERADAILAHDLVIPVKHEMTRYEDPASQAAQAQTEQVESWLASHRDKGTPRTQWSPVEDGRQADHAEALLSQRPMTTPATAEEESFVARQLVEEVRAEMLAEQESAEAPALATQAADTEIMDAALVKVRERTGSAVIRLLEKVWGRIRENHPELPDVVMVTGIGIGAGSNKWGHFAADGWTAKSETGNVRVHEMFMAGETLAKGANQVLQTMLHEGAHALAKTRGKQDTSRQGRWHNKLFRDMATEMGLEHRAASADKAHGYSFVTLTTDTIAEYADLLTELEAEIHLMVSLPGWLGGTDEDDKGGELIGKRPPTGESKSSGVKLVCRCAEPNIIRASKKVAAKGVLFCRDCSQHFTEADA